MLLIKDDVEDAMDGEYFRCSGVILPLVGRSAPVVFLSTCAFPPPPGSGGERIIDVTTFRIALGLFLPALTYFKSNKVLVG